MANRYWVGGSGTWNTTSTTNWSTSSGGASGASVPTAADSVFFDQAGTYTVTMTGALTCLDITVSAGTVTFATGTTPTLTVSGSMSLSLVTVWSSTGTITFNATTTGKTITTNGVIIAAPITFNGVGGGWTLGSALTTLGNLTITTGTFDTSSSGNYAVSCVIFSSNTSSSRTINLNGSTITVSSPSSTAINIQTATGLTFNAGTSTFVLNGSPSGFASFGLTFYSVRFTNTAATAITITGANTFNTLSFAGRTTVGITPVTFSADQTISTLTLNAGTAAAYRTFLASNTIGTQRTLSVGTLTAGAADYDFRDIAITGAAAPIAPTRAGDCKGNSGITFPAAKTVYWSTLGFFNWNTNAWNSTPNGASSAIYFPLAQDTAVFSATYPVSGSTITISNNYNIGTIDMSARTSNTMTLATGTTTPAIYGNWINGTGTTLTGTGQMSFAGRGSQTITSAGKTFTQQIRVNSPSGTVTLADAFTCSFSVLSSKSFTVTNGTFSDGGYNFSLTGTATSSGFSCQGSPIATVNISGTWSIACQSVAFENIFGSIGYATITGAGTISLTSASSKTFAGGGIQTYPTLNQGGTGALTITGSNKFAGMTNTAIGSVLFTGGTTNEFSSFILNGALANLLTLGSTNTTQAILKKPTSWQMGMLSTNSGNNTGLTFLSSDGTIEYLNVSYINGQVTTPIVSTNYGNFLMFFQ